MKLKEEILKLAVFWVKFMKRVCFFPKTSSRQAFIISKE